LRAVLRGDRLVAQPTVLSAVLEEFGHLLREREQERFGLTEQEITILRLAAAGLNYKDIGAQQFWSEITIKRKMRDIYRKMDVNGRAQAVAEAIRVGII
jgi:NarL family two-component system response regulator YdfI